MAKQVSTKLGIAVSEPKIMPINDDKTTTYLQALNRCKDMNPHMIVIILPMARADKYAAVKKFCCHTLPVPSQASQVFVRR